MLWWTQAMRGELMTGPALSTLIQRMVEALNLRDIPSAGSMLEYFNKDLLYSVKDTYVARYAASTYVARYAAAMLPLLYAASTPLPRGLHPTPPRACCCCQEYGLLTLPDCFLKTISRIVFADAAVD